MRRPLTLILRSRNRQGKAVRCITPVFMAPGQPLVQVVLLGTMAFAHSRYSPP